MLHVLLPHTPYRYLPSGRTYEGSRAARDYNAPYRSSTNRTAVDDVFQRYLLQLAYTDRVLGEIVRRLRSTGVWDRALVIATADEGISFQPGGHRRFVNSHNVADIAPVPLFVKRPWQRRGAVDDSTARSIDIVPTIADVLGIKVPWHLDGESLFAPDRRVPSEIVVKGYFGTVAKAPLAKIHAGQEAAVRQGTRSFGSGADSVFAHGAYRKLLGHEATAYEIWESATIRAKIRRPLTTRFDPRSSFTPSRVMGTLSGVDTGELPQLAVAVNGRIVAVTKSFRIGQSTRFETIVPDSAFHEGPNVITIFAMRGSPGGKIALAEIASKR
jgi:sulfatase-like protein